MVHLRWTLPALDDLDQIAAYIAQDSPRRADIFIREVITSANRLRDFPLSGRIIPDQHDPSLRELIYGNYRIMYEHHVQDNLVEIYAVLHSARLFDGSQLN
jgi:toxin ParE1/3/4